jgi:hypothetical protein
MRGRLPCLAVRAGKCRGSGLFAQSRPSLIRPGALVGNHGSQTVGLEGSIPSPVSVLVEIPRESCVINSTDFPRSPLTFDPLRRDRVEVSHAVTRSHEKNRSCLAGLGISNTDNTGVRMLLRLPAGLRLSQRH